MAREAEALRAAAGLADRIWVFWLGHANLGDGHAYLHLDGPDLRDDQFAALFRGLPCREQVFWITSACGGWLVKEQSAPGRAIIAATERDQEVNETEFPAALADTVRRPARELDGDNDRQVTLLEFYRATAQAVAARYQADNRVSTEHAQLDDNGDGQGTESPNPMRAGADGVLAATIVLAPRP